MPLYVLLTAGCPPGWFRHEQSCYYIGDTPTEIWSNAREKCKKMGADLAIIRSSTENDFVSRIVKKQKTATWFGAWLGLQRNDDSKFYWVDGTPLKGQYSAWSTGEPNNLDEKCGHMWGSTGQKPGKWNDLKCHLAFHTFGKTLPVVLCQKHQFRS